LWRLHILPPQQAFPLALATLSQQSPPLQQSAVAILPLPQQEPPSLQHAAPSLQQSPLAILPLQQSEAFLQHAVPSLQQEAAALESAGLSAGAGAAVCAHMLMANINVINKVLNFI
jgi:hypothetical protein